MSFLSVAFALFLITNPIGNTPGILAILRGIPPERQRIILLRETFFAAVLAIAFLFAGSGFLNLLGIQGYTVSLCGGALLIIVSFQMIFPKHDSDTENSDNQKEPMLVPIATPLLCGGGLLTTILLYAQKVGNNFQVACALLSSFVVVAIILNFAPLLNKVLGKRGLLALEQLMGMILFLLATEMLLQGTKLFIQTQG